MNLKNVLGVAALVIVFGLVMVLLKPFNKQDNEVAPEFLDKEVIEYVDSDEVEINTEAKTEEEKIAELEKKIVIPEPKKTDYEILREALASDSETTCQWITVDSMKAKCLDDLNYTRAIANNDIKICKNIKDQGTMQYCLDQIFLNETMETKDPALCSKIYSSSLKEKCIEITDKDIFLKSSAPEDCESIKDESMIEKCIVQLKVSSDNFTKESCSDVNDPDLKSWCEAKAVETAAINSGNVSACSGIVDASKREACETSIEADDQNQKIVEAVRQGNAQLCSTITDEKAKSACIDKANFTAMNIHHDIEYCQYIKDEDMKSRCLSQEEKLNMYWFYAAKNDNDIQKCKNITSKDLLDRCRAQFF